MMEQDGNIITYRIYQISSHFRVVLETGHLQGVLNYAR